MKRFARGSHRTSAAVHLDLIGHHVSAAEIEHNVESTREAAAQPVANFLVVDVDTAVMLYTWYNSKLPVTATMLKVIPANRHGSCP